ncbi:hypothetical protein K504DRAFT_167866 [Pleomassaria siparia CBS 279.74]|uniref:Elongator complex protein 5 n=1 Tax=Pleomassaria siparia CBS 279.74 TaxID=1314801 RepID=A0A6G1JUR3_9PLEO|nr:hypothetical protein K504DRAFT_167866 [Pleomassaria siparia CBS 279.74]
MMPPSSRIPPLLQPYTHLPSSPSTILLTSTLGASANWLIIRFLCAALSIEPNHPFPQHPTENYGSTTTITPASGEEQDGGGSNGSNGSSSVNVVLVSWMRDWDFWKQEARKGGGLDLERLRRGGRVAFVDGLAGLFVGQDQGQSQSREPVRTTAAAAARTIPQSRPLAVARGPPGRTLQARAPPQAAKVPDNASPPPPPGGHYYTLADPSLKTLESTIRTALADLPPAARKSLLILDAPDALLATTPSISPSALTSTLLALQTSSSTAAATTTTTTTRDTHVLVHLHADTALLSASTPAAQPLEIAGHNFLVKTAHRSRRVMSCRVLDTGVARDVSGVLRVTESDGWEGLVLGQQNDGRAGNDEAKGGNKELLYFVKGDGSVKVFERGAGG